MPLQDITNLLQTCKLCNQWLSDPTNFAWKKRIQLIFPSSYSEILWLPMKEQFAQLQKIDTLVAAGVKIRRLDLVPQFPNVTPVIKDERFFSKDEKGDRMYRKYHRVQLPWCKTLFVFNFETKVVLLDLATNQLRDQVELEIPWSTNSILFDVVSKS